MKTVTTTIKWSRRHTPRAALLLAAAVVLACKPASIRAGQQVPFKASFTTVTETAVDPGPPPILHVSWLGQGHATHLGAATAISTDQMVDLISGFATATWTMTGADGASVAVKATFQTTFLSQIQVTFEGSYAVTGGTGRFAGASGGGTFNGSATMQTPTGGVGEFTMTGTISPPGRVKLEPISANAGSSFALRAVPNHPELATMTVDGVAQVSLLGICSTHAVAEVRLPATPGGPLEVTQSTFSFTSSDGKTTITGAGTGPVTPDADNPAFAHFHYEVIFTGGTGCFANAGGRGEIDGAALFGSQTAGTGTFTLQGLLEVVDGHHRGDKVR